MTIFKVKETEQEYRKVFSISFIFNKNLVKFEDNNVKDKWDNNAFYYDDIITSDDIEEAINYQKNKGLNYVKIVGNVAINSIHFDINETNVALLYSNDSLNTLEPNMYIRELSLEEVTNAEISEFVDENRTEDFIRREIKESFEKLIYKGLFVDDNLVSYCYLFKYQDYTILDGLGTLSKYRHKGYATMLLKALCDQKTFLHAYINDTPLNMYKKMGFIEVYTSYEYIKFIKGE